MGTLVSDQGIMMLVTVAVIAICAVLALYVLYTVVWRAVRRGLREYHKQPVVAAVDPLRRVAIKVPNYPPSDWV